MLNILRRAEAKLPGWLDESWNSNGRESIWRAVDKEYIITLHRLTGLQGWCANNFAIKVIAGNCSMEIRTSQVIVGTIFADAGFEYQTREGQCVMLKPTDNTNTLVLSICHKEDLDAISFADTVQCPTQVITEEFSIFYPKEIPSPVTVVTPKPEFKWRISHDIEERCVLVDFEQATAWMALKPEEAEQAANKLLHHARKARGF